MNCWAWISKLQLTKLRADATRTFTHEPIHQGPHHSPKEKDRNQVRKILCVTKSPFKFSPAGTSTDQPHGNGWKKGW
jgi:hypothetical protein